MSSAEVDFSQPTLWISAGSVIFNPLAWNIIARNEYRNHTMTRIMGSALRGCYLLAFLIFTFGLLRDYLFTLAIDNQPKLKNLDTLPIKASGALLLGLGNVLVLSSMWKLGVTGTYLGDYFGILMEKRVTGFPFNTMENPMYNGSTMCFLGTALWYVPNRSIEECEEARLAFTYLALFTLFTGWPQRILRVPPPVSSRVPSKSKDPADWPPLPLRTRLTPFTTLLNLLFNVALPLTLYFTLLRKLSLIYVIIISSVPPVLYTLFDFITSRRLHGLGIMIILSFILSLIVNYTTQNVRILLFKDGATTFLFGLYWLFTLIPVNPLTRTKQVPFSFQNKIDDSPRYGRYLWDHSPTTRTAHWRMTMVWGMVYVLTFVAKTAIAAKVEDVEQVSNIFTVIDPVSGSVVPVLGIPYMIWVDGQVRREMQEDPEMDRGWWL
ncbi:Phosphatidyl-N-methylethanolamine N-methyltransferase [Rhizophlyctis rosea]|nr:Phosphatidyl-N-methylethanolamine N-methyltransferase [Rhizophlyctis rosea]